MSRTREILNRLEGSSSNRRDISPAPRTETSQLWPRFTKVFNAIAKPLSVQSPQGINRQLNTFDWSGADEGIHDHGGFVNGKTDGVQLNIKFKGTTIDDQPKYVIDPNGKWRLTHLRERYIDITGTFVSPDGQTGAVEMQHKTDGWHYKAFWLQMRNGSLKLEQVIGPDGTTFDADKLDPEINRVTIPETRITLDRFIQ